MNGELYTTLSRAHKIDLSHPLDETTPPWPGNTAFQKVQTADYAREGYFCAFDLVFAEHTGTHIDAPVHAIPGGLSVNSVPLDLVIGPGALLDLEAEVGGDRDYVASAEALDRWENAHGQLPEEAFVLVKTGWYRRYRDCTAYQGLDKDGTPHYPSLSPQLAEVLVKRGVKAVGIDTLSPDAGDAVYPHVHMTLLSRNILIIENLGDLSPMPPAGAVVIALPMNVRGGTGSPARVLAFVERNRDVGIPGG